MRQQVECDMVKIMGVRFGPPKPYSETRLAGRAGRERPPAPGRDPQAGRSPAGHSIKSDGQPGGRGCLWVLPRHLPYTGAEGADVASLWNFLTASSCFFGFGSGIWADAR